MPFEENALSFFTFNFAFGVKAFLILFLIFYAIFSLILYRQIQVMGKSLPTEVVPFLRFVGIVHIGVSLALFFLVLGLF